MISTAWTETRAECAFAADRDAGAGLDLVHRRDELDLLPSVQRLLNPEATGVTALLLLALGALTAGINILSWQIAFIGLVLAVSVPLKAWLQQGAVVVVLGLIVALIGLAVVYSWHRGADRKAGAPLGGS